MGANKRKSGRFYEDAAAGELTKRKYRILEKNIYINRTEIDLIALKGDTVVFTEVKARRGGSGFNPLEAVGKWKQKRIITAAKKYINSKKLFDKYIRFDVIGITFKDNGIACFEMVQDAFQDGD